MDFPPEVVQAALQLVQAVEVSMNAYADQAKRLEAYNLCEHFKESSPLCAQCGFYLARVQHVAIVRHFGLQLIEYGIKYRWNSMNQAEKVYIKEGAMRLLESGTQHLLVEPAHIKDGLSRIVVEMMKREWPQQWPTLLAELAALCQKGETQTELVLMVFLRIVEDVAVLQTLESNQRRKDIYQALSGNMAEIFNLFLQILQSHYKLYQEVVKNEDDNIKKQAQSHCQVAQGVLVTFAAFVEWVPINHVMCHKGLLLQLLCLLLRDNNLQNAAAECLYQIVSRKGRAEDRKPLLILFSEDAMTLIFTAADEAAGKPLDEPYYLFLKKLTQVLTGLGTQLCALWGKEDDVKQPPYFAVYLDAMLAFTKHPSLQLTSYVNSLWSSFFRHEVISQDPVLQSFITKWIEFMAPKVMKIGYPSRDDSAACAYSRLDFESDDEFSAFFHQCRTDILDTFRQVTLIAPTVTYSYVERWLLNQLKKDVDVGIGSENGLCTLNSPSYLEWDALSNVLDSVLSRILNSVRPKPSVETGLRTFDLCLAYETHDPVLLSTLLSCISALFVFLSMAPDNSMLPRVLAKIFASLVFTLPGQTKECRSRAVKNVRRHAASLLVKISQKYPLLLLPMFDHIHTTILQINKDPGQLSKLEKVTLQEALLLISNHFYDYDRQTTFVKQVISLGSKQWRSMENVFCDAASFMSFVGLDSPPVEPSSKDINGQNRSQILFCMDLFLAVIKRCSWPDDPDRAQKGNFIVGYTSAGNPIHRNPASPHILPLLSPLFLLAGVFNALWLPQAIARLSEGYSKAHGMLDSDRDNILGVSKPPIELLDFPKTQTPLERMQQFVSQVHDNCYHLLGNAGPSLGRDFYHMPDLANLLLSTVFSNLEAIPDYRLRPIVRVFLRPFACSCPASSYATLLLPILNQFCPYMFSRLSNKWNIMQQLYESGGFEEENADTQEILDDMLNRQLTKEYLDVLKVVLLGGSGMEVITDAMEQEDETSSTGRSHHNLIQTEAVSDLGQQVLRSEATLQSITLCILKALSWQDTSASLKATVLCGPVVRQLVSDGSITSEVANHTLFSVLQGLHFNGQHESNQGSLVALGVQIYETLRPTFPSVVDVLKQMPNCNHQELQKLDEKVMTPTPKGTKMEKAKKDVFKRLTSQLVGRSMSQLFKKDIHIRDLPPLKFLQPKKPNVVDTSSDIGLHALFEGKDL